MSTIRVGLIGLSGAPPDKYEGTSWTPSAHLPYITTSPVYEIVALLNTSVQSAKAAIERYALPISAKAYSKPEELAQDPDVDLVVCSVRVDKHFLTIVTSMLRSKCYLSKTHGSKTIVGLHGSFSPVIRKMEERVGSGKIGKVLGSTIMASLGNGDTTERKNFRYFLEREVGGNVVSIHLGHSLEFIASVLGEFSSFNSLMVIRNEKKDIIDPSHDNKILFKDAENTVPDQILLQGVINSGAPISVHYRGGPTFPGTPDMQWWIQGSKGELRWNSSSCSLNVGREDTKVELFDKETGKVEKVMVERDQWDELPVPAQNITRLYEAFRKGEWVPGFESAVERHEMLKEMWRRFDEKQAPGKTS